MYTNYNCSNNAHVHIDHTDPSNYNSFLYALTKKNPIILITSSTAMKTAYFKQMVNQFIPYMIQNSSAFYVTASTIRALKTICNNSNNPDSNKAEQALSHMRIHFRKQKNMNCTQYFNYLDTYTNHDENESVIQFVNECVWKKNCNITVLTQDFNLKERIVQFTNPASVKMRPEVQIKRICKGAQLGDFEAVCPSYAYPTPPDTYLPIQKITTRP